MKFGLGMNLTCGYMNETQNNGELPSNRNKLSDMLEKMSHETVLLRHVACEVCEHWCSITMKHILIKTYFCHIYVCKKKILSLFFSVHLEDLAKVNMSAAHFYFGL